MAKKLLTAEMIAAKKNVDQANIVEIDGKKFEALKNPCGVVARDGNAYVWVFMIGDVETLVCPIAFSTAEEAEKHCRKLMGIAWNFPVTVQEG